MKVSYLDNTIKICTKKGLDIPLAGTLSNEILDLRGKSKSFAVLGRDFIGLKPQMHVALNDSVSKGDVLFSDKKLPRLHLAAPVSGIVKAIHRGDKRVLLSVVIEEDTTIFEKLNDLYKPADLLALSEDALKDLLLKSGLWSAFRQRPLSSIANYTVKPKAIFVSVVDTNPLAPNPSSYIKQYKKEFQLGVQILSKLTDGTLYVCQSVKDDLCFIDPSTKIKSVLVDGPHPAGNIGTHIHALEPVDQNTCVWYISFQDVISITKTLLEGSFNTDRFISISGGCVKSPTLALVRQGQKLSELLDGLIEVKDEYRVISGSILSGRSVIATTDFLGRYDQQVSVIYENRKREFLGWNMPGLQKFSLLKVFISSLFPSKKFSFDTSTHGSQRAMVPIGNYERVMPLDILPTHLLRVLEIGDLELAIALGALELDEEDLALCTFVCPGKNNFGDFLRKALIQIEREFLSQKS